jgi:DtxR family Mn-dependent transcriptional regulator
MPVAPAAARHQGVAVSTRTTGHSESVEMYLKTLAVLGGGDRPVAVAQLAQRLEVTPVAANEMLRRLVREDLVTHEPYHGFRLAPVGRAAAWDVIRRERLWERFLVDRLELDSTMAAGWACLLEHATAPEVIDALDAYLGYPATCPQGQPIPRSIDDPVHGDDRSLAEVEVGETVRLVAFDDEGPEVLGYLRRHGLTLGAIVRVTELGPRGSLVTVDLPDATAVLGRDIAATIQTVVAEPAPAAHAARPA